MQQPVLPGQFPSESDSAEAEDWETSSEGSSAASQVADHPWFGPPLSGSPLYDAADEVVLAIVAQTLPPLFLEPHPRDLRTLSRLSMTCKRIRNICWPFLWRRACLKDDPDQDGLECIEKIRHHCQHLLREDVAPHVRALWLTLQMPDIHGIPGGSNSHNIKQVLDALLPRTLVLVLRCFMCTPQFLTALKSARKLKILDVDDGFVGNARLAEQAVDLPLQELEVYYCSISTAPQASAVPFKLMQGMERVQRLVVRAYHDRFPAGLFPTRLWQHLRILALDSGQVSGDSGLVSLFEEFQTYRQNHPCPLAEVYLEIRQPIRREFEDIVATLRGHQPLVKLNLMVLPSISHQMLAELATTLPQLQELHLVAFRSRTLVWPGEPAAYGKALAGFPRLRILGLNGVPFVPNLPDEEIKPMESWMAMISQTKSLEAIAVWWNFGETDYLGKLLPITRSADGTVTELKNIDDDLTADEVSFFPSRQSVIEPRDDAL